MGVLIQNIRYTVRFLATSVGFTTAVVISLVLGREANTTLFSVVNGVLLNPLPFPQSKQLIVLHERKPNIDEGSISYLRFPDWPSCSSLAISQGYSFQPDWFGERPSKGNAGFTMRPPPASPWRGAPRSWIPWPYRDMSEKH